MDVEDVVFSDFVLFGRRGVQAQHMPTGLVAWNGDNVCRTVNQNAARDMLAHTLEEQRRNDRLMHEMFPARVRNGHLYLRLHSDERPTTSWEDAVARAEADAKEVFKDSCNHTMQAIDYIVTVLRAGH